VATSYQSFLSTKHIRHQATGFDLVSELPAKMWDWQCRVAEWCCRKGRAAIFADCGLGKTIMQLAWCDQVRQLTRKPVLLLTPIAVGPQTVREAETFGVSGVQLAKDDSNVTRPGIYVTNYHRLAKFDLSRFAGVCLDESSILKSFTGATKRQLCEGFADTPYKLACTATAAPNDHMELGNHSEFLGVMPSNEMLSRWFINDTMKAGGYRLRGHARDDFWRWVSSWAVCISLPSDVGGSDGGYRLPELVLHKHIIEDDTVPPGHLFKPAQATVSATNVHEIKRQGLAAKANLVAEIVNPSTEAWSIWCDTDYEADALRRTVENCVEVRGSTREDLKVDFFEGFTSGRHSRLITKPEIGGFGMNWQHCRNTCYFAGFSFEKWYQAIRRHYRFGQTQDVNVHLIATDAEVPVIETLERKSRDHLAMQRAMSEAMREGLQEEIFGKELKPYRPVMAATLPAWLTRKEPRSVAM